MMTAGVILAVIVIVYSGIKWMTAGGEAKAVEGARNTLISGIWGVAIVLGVCLIIKTVASIVTGSFFIETNVHIRVSPTRVLNKLNF